MERSSEIPEHLRNEVRRTEELSHAFLAAMDFIVKDAGRDPRYIDAHMLSYTAQDYLQSAIALPMLVREGIHNVCRRELRFLLEMSIKVCRVQQQDYDADIPTKLASLQQTFETTNISMQKQVDLALLPEAKRASFREEVGRIHGETSGYVHWTSDQIHERIAMVKDGRTSGYETAEDIERLNGLIARTLAGCLVFLFHAVPNYVAGDWLVESDGSSLRWPFAGSQFVALMDEHFDYKHERQGDLQRIKEGRWSVVSF